MSAAGFTHVELTELGRIIANSHGKFDAAFGAALSSRGGGCAVKGWPRRAFVVGASSNWATHIGETLRDTGAGAQLRRLYEQQSADPAVQPHVDKWLKDAEQPTQATPDRQASACLTLLNGRNATVFQHRWLASLAARRLAHLLAQYPVLVHPRFAWEVKERKFRGVPHEPVPMLHAMLTSSVATLPSPHWGVDGEALKRFAVHPALAIALKSKSLPTLVDSSVVNGRTLSVAEMMNDRPRLAFVDALLRIERIRHVAHVAQGKEDKGLYEQGTVDYEQFMATLKRAFSSTWIQPYPGGHGGLPDSLLNEIAASPVHSREGLAQVFLGDATRVFYDPFTMHSRAATNKAGARASASGTRVRAPDALARFERLAQHLVACGVLEDANGAARALLREIFANDSAYDAQLKNKASSLASVEVAHAMILKWLSSGIEPAELARRMPSGAESGSPSPWRQALEIVETERAMIATIDAAVPAQGKRVNAAVRRRALV